MRKLTVSALIFMTGCAFGGSSDPQVASWEARARNVTIIRDDWGIPHVYGKTDADAVFGLIYAQAEDDFNRVETNYLNSIGRLAEAEGESAIWRDLRMKLFIDPVDMQRLYEQTPDSLKAVMEAWADGLNYFLHTHPEVKPRVITRFEPWMPLTFSEGSIGGDIERVNLRQLEAFYGDSATGRVAASIDKSAVAGSLFPDKALEAGLAEPSGSNGFAIAPALSATGNAILWINPHTSFFFRSEAQMVSEEGLNAYGASTWGQFFIYQGFNDRLGWMHTSSSVDNIDEYIETVTPRDSGFTYRFGGEERPVTVRKVTVPYKTENGMAQREFTVYRTHHGPIVRSENGKWIAARMMEEPLKALMQSWFRTKARNMAAFREVLNLHTNSSNNTVYADGDGNIAYFHANFVPERDTMFDWTRPVDGSNPSTDWQGVHSVDESPNSINPSIGWVQNTNNWPYSASGPASPRRSDYPRYMDMGTENARGIHAIRVLANRTGFTADSVIAAAYDSYLTAFEPLVPALLRAWEATPASSPLRRDFAEQIDTLRSWDLRWGVQSVATALAIAWADEAARRVPPAARRGGLSSDEYIATRLSARDHLEALASASANLMQDFGNWKTPWGEINRFQRISPEIVHPFSDSAPSIPVGFTSARWGSLASFGARSFRGSKRIYGTSGNSFVAVVEFGDSVRARAVTAGGQSGDPTSPHFNDQAERYATGNLRPVYFYRHQLEGHTEREYRPGERRRD
ncbi:MAG: acylase [Gemmatimonadota bacterium]